MLAESKSHETGFIKRKLVTFTKVMIRAFNQHINTNLPFLKSKKLLVAISGGIDSVVLTHLLFRAKLNISLAHCNFSLRGKESNKDERFILQLGKTLNIPAYSITFNTNSYAKEKGISTQMAARDLRYNWFKQLCKKQKLDYVITAHHKDDEIETFIINLTRGTGLDGLKGITAINNNIVRPLLPFSQEEILIYATKNKLQWREDSSNSSIKYIRNKIRHKVVPILKEINPNLLNSFSNTLDYLNDSRQIISDRIEQVSKNIITQIDNETHFNCKEILKLSNPKAYLYEFLKSYNFTEWNDVCELLKAQSGKQIFSKTHQLLKNRDVLILTEIKLQKEAGTFKIKKNTIKISDPIKLKFETIHIPFEGKNKKSAFDYIFSDSEKIISLDLNKLQFPLLIRKWQKGDYFSPVGLKGKKKLSKFFKDEKLSVLEKENTWILTSNNEIAWVIGKRLDERFKVTNLTSEILKIKIL